MLKTKGWLITVIMVLAGCTSSGYQPHSGQTLNNALTTIWQTEVWNGASIGIMVRDANSGKLLYQTHSDRLLVPASNMKLLTSSAAFGVLGADYYFETRLLTTGKQEGNTLLGDLYIQGSGDPTLHPKDLDAFAEALAGRGIKHIHGRLILDDSAFDKIPFGTGWSWDDEDFSFAAPISALNYSFTPSGDINVVRVDVRPSSGKGKPGKATFYPSNREIKLINNTTTGEDTELTFERLPCSNQIVVSGNIAVNAGVSSKLITIDKPTRVVGALLQAALETRGITLSGGVDEGQVPVNAQVVASKTSEPLSQLAIIWMKLSNNGYSEIMTKAMGSKTQGKGDWHSGLQAISNFMQSLGINTKELQQVDGSGLSRMNLVTPHQLTTLLLAARKQPWFAAWHNSLPVAGEPGLLVGGTLRNRMVNSAAAGRTYAKTGSLTGASSLSGYVDSATARPLVFAIMSNNYLVSGSEVKRLEDKIVETLAACDATVVCR